ncbi:hypothetical protein BSL78_07159 [Apostichopus japonicus]|uniref:SMB domain-containing protein n=1 Tax=Stichopus japonicus TaxID=307972 RepID=A0A2G8L6N6_STIJA|nr:hypothetical protein BSL78_07159 [Apostichopus japonicus]
MHLLYFVITDAVLTSTLQTWELQCPKATETPDDGQRFCDKTTLCASNLHSSTRCQCDDLCQYYGDCCFDALEGNENPDIVVPSVMELETCQSDGIYGSGYYMISKCPEEFVDSNIRSLCEQVNPDDILLNTPATDRNDKKLFRNLYCAICHERIIDNLYFWKLTVTCANEPADSDSEGGKSDSKDDGAFDDGTSAFDDGTSAFDDGTSAFDDGTSAFDDEHQLSTMERQLSTMEHQLLTMGLQLSTMEHQLSTMEHQLLTMEHQLSTMEHQLLTMGLQLSTTVLQLSTTAHPPSTMALRLTIPAKGTKAPPEDLRLLWENLRNPKCVRKFSYRLEGRDPYRRCTPIDVNSFEDDRQMQTSCPSYVAPYLSNGTTYKNLVPRYEPQTEGERDQSDHFMVRGEIYVHESEDVCFSSNTEHCSEIKEAISVVLTALIRSEIADFQDICCSDIDCVDSSNQVQFCFQEQGPSKLCTFRGDLLSDTPNVYQDLRQRSNYTVRDESYRNLSCLYMPLMNIQTFTLTPGNVSCSSLSIESQTSSIGFVWREELNDTQITSVSGYCSGILTCKSDYVHFNSLDVKVINVTHIYISKTEQFFKRGTYYERPDGISICTDYLDVCKARRKFAEDRGNLYDHRKYHVLSWVYRNHTDVYDIPAFKK